MQETDTGAEGEGGEPKQLPTEQCNSFQWEPIPFEPTTLLTLADKGADRQCWSQSSFRGQIIIPSHPIFSNDQL